MGLSSSERMSMDFSLISCTTSLRDVQTLSSSLRMDRLSSLPDDLLLRILCLLPTKDAAATCVLSKRMWRVFPWITSLDFDGSPISHCVKNPYGIERFPTFVNFVDTVLYAHQSQYLTRFRLRVGVDFINRYFRRCPGDVGCRKCCFPDLKFTHIKAWISIPLTRCGLTELDLCIHVSEHGYGQLPPEIFTCETLVVLKLDVNLVLDRAYTLPSFRIPNLKLFHLRASLLSDDGFVTRLVSSCPLLEDLTVQAWWTPRRCISISSTSLRRLCLKVYEYAEFTNPDFVLINTPNLEYLTYYDNLASQHCTTNMPSLVEAHIDIGYDLLNERVEASYAQMLMLIRPLSNVQHLSLCGYCMEDLNFVEVKDQIPLFRNLKYLELGYTSYTYWDKVLLAFLNCSPVLETLAFPEGTIRSNEYITDRRKEPLKLEQEFFRTTQAIPLCCRSHLKRILIQKFFGEEREVNFMQFLLRHALILEELVVCQPKVHQYPIPDQLTLESMLRNLPRASVTCSIQVQ